MNERDVVDLDFIKQVHQEAVDRARCDVSKPIDPNTIHFSQLSPDPPSSPLSTEWNFYLREVGRLLPEGHEFKWVLIKGEELVGIWHTRQEARTVVLHKYCGQSCLIHEIRRHEPLVQTSRKIPGVF